MTASPPTERPLEPNDPGGRGSDVETDTGNRLMAAPRVFLPAAGFLVLFTALCVIFTEEAGDLIMAANDAVVGDLGWFYVAVVTGFVFFSLWIALSPMGSIVLAKNDDEEAEFGLFSWFAMLFAAGMGIGLVYWGVAEPLSHYSSPPPGTADNGASAARNASDVTLLHWGLHAWAIYVVVGLAIAYATHRKGRPISIRYALEPLFGDKIKGWFGDVVDVIAIVGTLFGVATSLGFGVQQVGSGLSYLGVVEEAGTPLLVGLIAIITAFALVSVLTGVDKGIRYLSNINMGLAGVLLLAVLLLGPTVFLLGDFITSIGSYLQNFLRLSFDVRPFQGGEGQEWLGSWTTYYWGWWMSWAPFVGVFIARISKGRTVREFVMGVLLVPTLVTSLWFAIMGGSAIYAEMFGNGGLVGEDGVNTDTALFQLFDTLPLSTLLSVVALFLIVVFFVTSSDSGSFVVDMLAEGGSLNPPAWSRAFWASMEGVLAAVLLAAGGLAALQTMSILVAAPFSIIMVLMAVATAKALLGENKVIQRRKRKWLAEQVANELRDSGEIPAIKK